MKAAAIPGLSNRNRSSFATGRWPSPRCSRHPRPRVRASTAAHRRNMASSSRPARARYLSSIVPTSLIPEKSGNHSECSSYFCWGPKEAAGRIRPASSRAVSHLGDQSPGLRMFATGTGNTGFSLPNLAWTCADGDISQGNSPHQTLIPTDYRQAPDLDLGHVLHDLIDVFILEAVFHVGGHDIAYLGLRTLVLGNGPNRDVAVGDHADQAVIFSDRYCSRIQFRHHFGSLTD